MTISFSGLASGLDTSSWVEALTSLRRAKVTTLETKKQEIETSRDALNTIKSFFNAFRTSIEKVTDAKFGIATMDIFQQNIATSTDLSKLTASASTEAEEASYNIKVYNKANATEASSTYNSTVTTVATATEASTLKSLTIEDSIHSGTIFVTVDGVTRSLNVNENETINSFVNKLNNIGVDASYNESSGKLNLNVSLSDIEEGSTNIINALHLDGVNEGYQSQALQYATTITNTDTATLSTKLSELGTGVSFNNKDAQGFESVLITNSSGQEFELKVNENTTIGNFIDSLNNAGLYASLSNSGILEITGGEITGGTFNANEVFGLSQDTNSAMVVCNALTTTILTPDVINLQTRIVEDLGVTRGYYEISTPEGTNFYNKIYSGMTVADLMSDLGNHGITAVLDGANGIISITGGTLRTLTDSEVQTLCNDVTIQEPDTTSRKGTNFLTCLGYNSGNTQLNFNNVYTYNNIVPPQVEIGAISSETKLSDIISGTNFKEGIITVVKNGVQHNLSVNGNDTLGGFMDTLSTYGFESVLNDQGQLIIQSTGDSRLQTYTVNPSDASNILDIIGANASNWNTSNTYLSNGLNVITTEDSYIDANEDTLLSNLTRIAQKNSSGEVTTTSSVNQSYITNLNGNLELIVDGESNLIAISSDETIGTLLNKFRALGLEATIGDGKITIHSGYKELSVNTPTSGGSSILSSGLLAYNSDIGGYVSSTDSIISTTYSNESLSASSWADSSSKLGVLNISSGTFSVYRDGMKALINVSSGETFESLQNKINNELKSKYGNATGDIKLKYDQGYLTMYSEAGVAVTSGSSTDTSNITSVLGLHATDDGTVQSSCEMYKANISTKLTTDGAFRLANITTGTFTVGNDTFTIDSSTTINDVLTMINTSTDSGAVAYWDDFYGKLVIQSKVAGATLVNIEAGTSNFTDVMGFTASERDNSNNITSTTLNTEAQVLGSNAMFTVNGTLYSSNSNTIGSDITRIQGLTLNLKDVTESDEEITITVKRDVESVSTAMSDVVTAYNDLMEAVDEAIASGGSLSDQTSLKMIRNQIRSYMTGSLGGSYYRNLDAIGISVDAASSSNISTSTESITKLSFNEEKFKDAFTYNNTGIKYLLLGDNLNNGIFSKIEDLIENALKGVSGYFDTQKVSYNTQISTLNQQITKANKEIAIYQEQLESKFQTMDMLISNMQQQYTSFLSS